MAGDPADLLPPLAFKQPGVPLRNYSGYRRINHLRLSHELE